MNTCYKTSDNKYKDCPPRMSDGRHFTDYRPVCDVNNLIKLDRNIMSSFDYRGFLQNNGSQLIERNREKACMENCCGPCDETLEGFQSTMLPEQTVQVQGSNSVEFKLKNPNGLGLGRDYGLNSSPEVPFGFSFNSRENECSMLEDKHNLYGDLPQNSLDRNTMPRGGEPVQEEEEELTLPMASFQPNDPLGDLYMPL